MRIRDGSFRPGRRGADTMPGKRGAMLVSNCNASGAGGCGSGAASQSGETVQSLRVTPVSRRDLSFPTKVRLLDAAIDVFAERGFENGFIREIAEKADANIAAINYHYGSKERLADAVLEFALAGLAAPEADPSADPAARLRALVADVLEPDGATRRLTGILARLIGWQVVRRPDCLARRLSVAEWPVFARTRQVVGELRPDLSSGDVAAVSWALLGQMLMLRLSIKMSADSPVPEAMRPGPDLLLRATALAETLVEGAGGGTRRQASNPR